MKKRMTEEERVRDYVRAKSEAGDIRPVTTLRQGKRAWYAPEQGYIFLNLHDRVFQLLKYEHNQDANYKYYVLGI